MLLIFIVELKSLLSLKCMCIYKQYNSMLNYNKHPEKQTKYRNHKNTNKTGFRSFLRFHFKINPCIQSILHPQT